MKSMRLSAGIIAASVVLAVLVAGVSQWGSTRS